MKKILTLFAFSMISTIVIAQQNNMQNLRSNGFSWSEPGSTIYSGQLPTNFHICTLDRKALVISETGESFTIKDNSCVVISGTQLLVSSLEGGVMVKPIIYQQDPKFMGLSRMPSAFKLNGHKGLMLDVSTPLPHGRGSSTLSNYSFIDKFCAIEFFLRQKPQ